MRSYIGLVVLCGLIFVLSACSGYSVKKIIRGSSQLPTHRNVVVKPVFVAVYKREKEEQIEQEKQLRAHKTHWWPLSMVTQFSQQQSKKLVDDLEKIIREGSNTGGQWVFSGLIMASIPFYIMCIPSFYTAFFKK